ncbi:MAG: 7-carboxy-7-deazaguanine synthase QueE [Euryarchaeota archaeon]|nr:7-carboxy-7-deazaguanine synthase QueE [Euryarchaeota archaeon]
MRISEIFGTLQGEGPALGEPSIFLRLSGCNLRCVWCDTKYTWQWEVFDRSREERVMTVEEVVEEILCVSSSVSTHNMVLTGGEPLLQQRELKEVIGALIDSSHQDWHFDIETAGTLPPDPVLMSMLRHVVVSPKLSSSGNDPRAAQRLDVLTQYAQLRNSWFKFVVASDEDYTEMARLVGRLGIDRTRVFLMAEGATAERQAATAPTLAARCARDGYRFSPRLHILLWGTRRGV